MLNAFESLEQTTESYFSTTRPHLNVKSLEKHLQTLSETDQLPPQLHQLISFIVTSLVMCDIPWLKLHKLFRRVEINITSIVTHHMRRKSL